MKIPPVGDCLDLRGNSQRLTWVEMQVMLTLVLSTRLLSLTLYGKDEVLPMEGGRVRSGCGRALGEEVRSVPLPKAWIAFPEQEEEGGRKRES